MQKITEISAKETFIVRHPVLRPGKPIESCHFDGDNLPTTKHFGLFLDNKLTGVISIFETKNNLFDKKNQIQIRGMAVLENHKKKGLGSALVIYCETHYKKQNIDLIWFNARTEAVVFYEKMGYQKKGTAFDIQGVGEHIIMFKEIIKT